VGESSGQITCHRLVQSHAAVHPQRLATEEGLARHGAARSIADGEGKTVAGGVRAIVGVFQSAAIDVGLGERAIEGEGRTIEQKLAVGGQGCDGVGDRRRPLLGIHERQLGGSDRAQSPFIQGQARVGADRGRGVGRQQIFRPAEGEQHAQ